jgi:hypothetical protein
MWKSITANGRTHDGFDVSDIAMIELLSGKTSAPRDIIERLDRAGLIDIVGEPGKTYWALTSKGRERALAMRPHEARLREHFSPRHTAGGCAIRGVASSAFTGAPRARRMS